MIIEWIAMYTIHIIAEMLETNRILFMPLPINDIAAIMPKRVKPTPVNKERESDG